MKTIRNKWTVPLASAAVAAFAVAAVWFTLRTPGLEEEVIEVRTTDFVDITSDLDSLTASADTVVMGTVDEVAQTGVDSGKEGRSRPMAYTLYKLGVEEALKGDVSGSIYVYQTDPAVFPDQPLTNLTVGDLVVLYLSRVETYAPVSEVTSIVYVPIALDNGVFDVVDDGAVGVVNEDTVVRPRGIGPSMFAEGTEFTAAQVRQAIESEGPTGPVGDTQ